LLVIECNSATPEPLRAALVGAFGESYASLCMSVTQAEQAIVNAFSADHRTRNLQVSVPPSPAAGASRLVININTAGAAPPQPHPWPKPQVFQTGPQSFQLLFPPLSGNSPWAHGRQVNIELNPPRADCGLPAPQEFRSYIDLFVLALQRVFFPASVVDELQRVQGQAPRNAHGQVGHQRQASRASIGGVPASPARSSTSSLVQQPQLLHQRAMSAAQALQVQTQHLQAQQQQQQQMRPQNQAGQPQQQQQPQRSPASATTIKPTATMASPPSPAESFRPQPPQKIQHVAGARGKRDSCVLM
jgi:hypothetical protein